MEASNRVRNECVVAAFDTITNAAERLGIDPEALRARCRRAARRHAGAPIVPLGGGIVAFKFGSSWRIRFPASLAERRSEGSRQ
jgi:hypothetical protein